MNRALRGFSLMDVIIGVALLLIVFTALFGVLKASLTLSTLAKAKAAAVELASTQMEYLRGLSYDSLGTVGGIPSGPVAQQATSTVDGIGYGVRTLIEYYDDPADGLGASDQNGVTTDYKIAKVVVSYAISGLAKSTALVSSFAPPGIESSTGGGTLAVHVVNASGAGLAGVSVEIVNAALSPTVNFTTFSNASGYAIIGGAATSSAYQVYVSESGYSSAQTYARDSHNVNPTPGYLTIAKNQTTSATFAIDRLATLTLASYAPALTTAFTDSFADASNLASQSGTTVAGSALTLVANALSGSAHSLTIAPSALDGWGVLSADLATPGGTSAVVHVDDASGAPLSDAALPGNGTGFSSFPVSLTALATSSYPALSLEADLASNSTSTAPSVLDWSLSHTEGPTPVPNVGFTLTGAKTIGTDSNNLPIYKTTLTSTTGAGASATEQLEWDAYALTLSSGSLIESCPESPLALSPASATTSALIVGTPSANTLAVSVADSVGHPVPGAVVVVAALGYAATVPASSCGLAFFNNLASGSYTASARAPGHTATTTSVSVSGASAATLTFP